VTATVVNTDIDPPRTWGVRGIGRLLAPLLVRRQARTEMPHNLAELKRMVEGQP
jgi:hypothetical protein